MIKSTLDSLLVDEPRRYTAMATALEQEIAKEGELKEQCYNDHDEPLYYDENGNVVTEACARRQLRNHAGELLYVAPPDMTDTSGRTDFSLSELWERHFRNKPEGLRRLEAWGDSPVNEAISREPRKPVQAPMRYSKEHIAARRSQLEELRTDAQSLLEAVRALRTEQAPPFWAPELRAELVRARLDDAERELASISARLSELVERVEKLPERAS